MSIGHRLIGTAAVTLAVLSPLGWAQGGESRDIINTALTVHKFNTFLSLVRDADLTFELKEPGPYTVFIPSNEAFSKAYSPQQLEALLANKPRLRKILLHHVVRGRLDAVQAAKSYMLEPLAGGSIRTGIVNGRGHIGSARFTIPNVRTSNGIIHGIDQVLIPVD